MTSKNLEGYNQVERDEYDSFVKFIRADDRTERREDVIGLDITTHYVLWCSPDEVKAIAKQFDYKLQPKALYPRFCVSSPLVFHKDGQLEGHFVLDLVSVMTDYVEVARNV